MSDLAIALVVVSALTTATATDQGPTYEALIKSLAEAIRRVERRQDETESLLERLENNLRRTSG